MSQTFGSSTREGTTDAGWEETRVEARLRRLERQVVRQRRAGVLLLMATIAVVAVMAAGPPALLRGAAQDAPASEDQVLRARGLVIVDEAGRERILIGAPIPDAENRVRTDMVRVEETWGPRFPRAYIDEYYPTYRHRMHGMLVLDRTLSSGHGASGHRVAFLSM